MIGRTKANQEGILLLGSPHMPVLNSEGPQFSPPKPKEHGAWGMLFIPFVTGVGIAGSLTIETLWLLIAVTFAFLSQKPYANLLSPKQSLPGTLWMRRNLAWFCVYGGTSSGLFAYLYLYYQMKGLKIFGLLGVPIVLAFSYFIRSKQVRTMPGELAGIIGLTMTGPMAHYAATGLIQAVGFWLWVLCILYFASSIFYVKAVVQSHLRVRSKMSTQPSGMETACRFYHIGLAIILLELVILKCLPLIAAFAFIPIIIRGLWAGLKSRPRLNFAIIGWTEVGYSIFFALVLIVCLRVGPAFPFR